MTGLSASGSAQPVTPEQALERLFTSAQIADAWFTPDFLSAVPLDRIDHIVASLRRDYGPFRSVRVAGDHWVVELERAGVPTRLALDAEGRFAGLFFTPPLASGDDVETLVGSIARLPGQVGLLVLEDGAERAALHPDQPLSVGSAFKMLLLRLLAEEIAAGRRAWSDVVAMKPEWRSPGSMVDAGVMTDWPEGAPVTLSTLAILMISLSDNTASDAVFDLLGRNLVEAAAPARNRPFLSTREMTLLKFSGHEDLLARYRTGDEAQRRAVLAELAGLPVPPPGSARLAEAAEVGWFFTARELCDLIATVETLPAMQVHPGPAAGLGWSSVAFKGGSLPGGLNMTTLVADEHGRHVCVAATWNNDAGTDDRRFAPLYRGLLAALRQPSGGVIRR